MSITLYSFLMALIWSSIFVVLLVLFRRKNDFIYTFGTTSILLLFAGFIIRLALPVEFPFVKEIGLYDGLYADVDFLIRKDIYSGITILDIVVVIWAVVSVILLVKLLAKHISFIKAMLRINNNVTPRIIEFQKKVEAEVKVENVHIICSSYFEVPMCTGLKKLILLPDKDYTDEDLYYILKHEYTHLKNKDMHLKMLIEVFIAIFWWNPFVYLLRYDLEDILEIKCDLALVGNEDRDVKTAYLQTIIDSVKDSSDKQIKKERLATSEFVNPSHKDGLLQRFNIVINYKPNIRKRNLNFLSFIIMMLLTLSVSYMFVLQPANTAPQEEIVESDGEFEMTTENTYILKTEDGKYVVISDNGYENEIDETVKEIFVSNGFEIREG